MRKMTFFWNISKKVKTEWSNSSSRILNIKTKSLLNHIYSEKEREKNMIFIFKLPIEFLKNCQMQAMRIATQCGAKQHLSLFPEGLEVKLKLRHTQTQTKQGPKHDA